MGTHVRFVETTGSLQDQKSHQNKVDECVRYELAYRSRVVSATTTVTILADSQAVRITTLVFCSPEYQ